MYEYKHWLCLGWLDEKYEDFVGIGHGAELGRFPSYYVGDLAWKHQERTKYTNPFNGFRYDTKGEEN